LTFVGANNRVDRRLRTLEKTTLGYADSYSKRLVNSKKLMIL